jgi:mono/diheme cytochrome c family protein
MKKQWPTANPRFSVSHRIAWCGVTVLAAVVSLSGLCDFSQGSQADNATPPQTAPWEVRRSSQGRTMYVRAPSDLYVKNCARCHGKDGKGKEARGETPNIPDLTSHKWHEQRSDAQLVASILDGKGKDMPAFGDKITEEQARQLVKHLRQFDSEKSKPQNPPNE